MDKPFLIRPAVLGDASEIVRLVSALAAFIGDAAQATVTEEALGAAWQEPHARWRGFVGEDANGRMVGACLYSFIFSTWRGKPGLYIIDLFVEPDTRGTGLGRDLLAAAARDGRDNGCGFIRLEVDHDNPVAAGFYLKLGFSETTRNRTFSIAADAFQALARTAPKA